MSMDKEIEEQRKYELKELTDSYQDPQKQFGPGTFGEHELLDRAMMAFEFFDAQVVRHPACVLNADLFFAASKAYDALTSFYQMVGNKVGDAQAPAEGVK